VTTSIATAVQILPVVVNVHIIHTMCKADAMKSILLCYFMALLIGEHAVFGWRNDNGALIDGEGRERFFRGVNVVYK